jgi:hypothetical protein
MWLMVLNFVMHCLAFLMFLTSCWTAIGVSCHVPSGIVWRVKLFWKVVLYLSL